MRAAALAMIVFGSLPAGMAGLFTVKGPSHAINMPTPGYRFVAEEFGDHSDHASGLSAKDRGIEKNVNYFLDSFIRNRVFCLDMHVPGSSCPFLNA